MINTSPLTDSDPAAISCPTNFIAVPADTSVGVSAFCVMKFKAKDVAGVATSQGALTPWVSITLSAAKTACTDLGPQYDLISNPEWLALARNIETVPSNWSGDAVGVGMLSRGHSDDSPSEVLATIDEADAYDGTGNDSSDLPGSGWEQKRTLTLSNDEVIWDLSGNTTEWVDWSPASGLQGPPLTCTQHNTEFPDVICPELLANDYLPTSPAYENDKGIGMFIGNIWEYDTIGVRRGGEYDADDGAGVFALKLFAQPTWSNDYNGFRCVYRL
jgi:hypothetical protein